MYFLVPGQTRSIPVGIPEKLKESVTGKSSIKKFSAVMTLGNEEIINWSLENIEVKNGVFYLPLKEGDTLNLKQERNYTFYIKFKTSDNHEYYMKPLDINLIKFINRYSMED